MLLPLFVSAQESRYRRYHCGGENYVGSNPFTKQISEPTKASDCGEDSCTETEDIVQTRPPTGQTGVDEPHLVGPERPRIGQTCRGRRKHTVSAVPGSCLALPPGGPALRL